MKTRVRFVAEGRGWIPKAGDVFVTTSDPDMLRICYQLNVSGTSLRYVQFDGSGGTLDISLFEFIKMTPAVGEPVLFVVDKVGMDPSITPTIAEEPATKKDSEK